MKGYIAIILIVVTSITSISCGIPQNAHPLFLSLDIDTTSDYMVSQGISYPPFTFQISANSESAREIMEQQLKDLLTNVQSANITIQYIPPNSYRAKGSVIYKEGLEVK